MKHGEKIRKQILEAGLQLWQSDASKINARNIAEIVGKTHPTIYHHYPTKKDLLEAIARHGVEVGDSVVIVSLMLAGSPLIASLSAEERQKHLDVVKSIGEQTHSDNPSAK